MIFDDRIIISYTYCKRNWKNLGISMSGVTGPELKQTLVKYDGVESPELKFNSKAATLIEHEIDALQQVSNHLMPKHFELNNFWKKCNFSITRGSSRFFQHQFTQGWDLIVH